MELNPHSPNENHRLMQLERRRNQARQRRASMSQSELLRQRELARLYYHNRRQRLTEEELSMERERRRVRYREQRASMGFNVVPNSSRRRASEVLPDAHNVPNIDQSISLLQDHVNAEVTRIGGLHPYPILDITNGSLQLNLGNNDELYNVGNISDPYEFGEINYLNYHQEPPSIQGENGLFHELPPVVSTGPMRILRQQRPRKNCARNFVDSTPLQRLRLNPMKICNHCQAKLFPHETQQLCCLNGKISLPIPPTPPQLLTLYTAQSNEAIHFRQNIRSYNHVFAFTSMGVHLDQNLANGNDGVYTYRAQGSIYHRIGSLLPEDGVRPRYLQMYVFDTDRELDYRVAENDLVDRQVLAILKQILDECNPFVHVFRQISRRNDIDNIRLQIKETTPDRHQYTLPTASQVAAVLIGGEDLNDLHERDIIVQARSGELLNIPDTAGFYDPLQYPLLHPYGTFGWDLNIFRDNSRRISTREYYSYMLQIRDNHDCLLLRAGRLLQQYVVDQYVKISTQQLRYIRDNQQTIRAELYQGLRDSVNAGEVNTSNVGRKTILPPSYIGSPRDMHRRYHDAMALVRKFGKPDIFLTMTCNPNWPEIQEQLYPGQMARDRPDLTTRVFHAKCEELKKDLFEHHVLGKVIAHVHVIEFQKRGLPHSHFLIILDESDKLRNPDDYDKVVRAEIPDPILEPELYDIVIRHMIHGPCGPKCMKNDKCKKKFPKEFSDYTVRGNDSFPIYKRPNNGRVVLRNGRREVDNRWVVPYNPWLLKRYDCHINVEICSSIKSVKYLYKYVYKGADRVMVEVSTSSHVDHDEIKQFVDARWVCPQEAFWRIFMFPLNRMYPAVYSLQVHLQDMHEVRFHEHRNLSDILRDQRNSRTMLTEFFETNRIDPEARQYLYEEFPEFYRWDKDHMKWHKRRNQYRVVGRLCNVSPVEGERYYLRLLLNHRRGPVSFNDLKTINSVRCATFKEAAELMGLLEGDNAIRETLIEAASVHMPSAMRKLFVIILIYCNPTGVRDLWTEFHSYMMEDYPSSSSGTHSINCLLTDLQFSLSEHGKCLSDFDLPSFQDYPVENTDVPKIILEEQSVPIPEDDLLAVHKLNFDQMRAYNKITNAVRQNQSAVFFIDGPGGTGKTFLYRSILASLRKDGHIAIATATSGIAAIMMPGGRTAHSRFKIPVPTLPTSTCMISKQSDLARLLHRADVIIWDEATMAHRYTLEALDRTLKDLFDGALPFGGKIIVLGGDFRQVLPIVTHGTRSQTIDACITSSPLWQHVQVLQLHENMRAKSDPSFSEMLLNIGNGTMPHLFEDMIRLPDDLVIPWENDHSLNRLINEVFPRLASNAADRNYMTQRALLTPKNKHVDLLNEQVIQIFPGEQHTYYSFDYVENDTRNLYTPEFLHSISPGELPPHKLTLKLGSPIILLRNLDPKNGLCNGTRLLCRGFYCNFIYAEIISGSFSGQPALIPRIPLKSSEDIKIPFILTRKQFPVRLSFALTINKSQGQTIPHVGVYLPQHVFTHGQLYVALSRGKARDTTKILVKNGNIDGLAGTHTRNVVFSEVLT